MPPMPTYAPTVAVSSSGQSAPRPALPGYPFYVAALAGHRPPQPPRDMAHDGGLPRHLVTSVPASGVTYGDRGRFDVQIHAANLKLLPAEGTPPDSAAIGIGPAQALRIGSTAPARHEPTPTDVDTALADAYRRCLAGKKAGHDIDDPSFLQPDRPMSAIGG